MGRRITALVVLLPLIGAFVACERTKSSNPLSPSIAGPIAGVTVDVPKAVAPAPASQIAVEQQPITLMIQNAVTNGPRPVSYIFEISTEATFSAKVFIQNGVEPGEGTTSIKLPQSLEPERKYYWRVRADDGANASEYSEPVEFTVYTPVVIQAPALREPSDGASGAPRTPTLSVTNAQRTGPAGAIQYLFEVATDAAFASKVASSLVKEGSGETSYTVPTDLAYSTTYYWRAKAMDPSHEGPHSSIRSFKTLAAPVVIQPPPSPGPGPGSGSGPDPNAIDDLNMSQATMVSSPVDLGSWPASTKITALDLRTDGVHIEFSKQDGGDRWPDVFPPGWDEPLQYTLGMCLNIGGRWYCSAPIQFWHGLERSGGPPGDYAENWFYDPGRWAPMTGHQPTVGEKIGFFACAGNCRNNTAGSNSSVKERTNVVVVPFPGNGGGSFRF